MFSWHSLFDDAAVRDLAPGETLFRREDRVRSMFLIRTGDVALERPMADGTALTLHVAGKGSMLAEASLFADSYHCDAVARGMARVAGLPRSSPP